MKIYLLFALSLIASSCTSDIQVIDKENHAIEDVRVTFISKSMTQIRRFTDEHGQVNIPWSAQEVMWASFDKEGYKSKDNVSIRDDGRIRFIVLDELNK